MTEHGVSIRISRSQRDTFRGKVLLILLLGALAGYWFHQSVIADLQRLATLTPESYAEGYQAYRDSLVQERWPLGGHIALVVAMIAVFFGGYELVGGLLGRATAFLFPGSRAPASQREPPDGDLGY